MPRYKEPFTIFPRKLPSGKTVYYYRTYTPEGVRSTAHSTGKTSKTLARQYCSDLLIKGQLLSNFGVTFEMYAKGFFDDNSQWMLDKIQISKGKKQPIARATLSIYRHFNSNIIIPFFKKMKLIDIRPLHIKQFRAKLVADGFANSTINIVCACLKIIVNYAMADKLILNDPFASIQQMYVNARSRDGFTLKELLPIFNSKWEDNENKLFALIGACTGLRISEICAIRKETLFPNYIDVKDQCKKVILQPVKDGENRKVPICKELHDLINSFLMHKTDFLFTKWQSAYRNDFFLHAGLTLADRKEKHLTFHSLRHFLNTYLLSNNVAELKVKSVLGHSSGKGSMTERYLNFKVEDFSEVVELQRELLKQFTGGSYDITLQ